MIFFRALHFIAQVKFNVNKLYGRFCYEVYRIIFIDDDTEIKGSTQVD